MIGHELFTLFQKDHGQDPYTVFSEVGAYLFGGSVKLEGFGKPPIYNAGTTYGSATTNLMGEFSSQDYHDAARTFKEANAPTYDNYPDYERENASDSPLIRRMYPLTPYY
jgi:hypothetical protein